MNNKIEKFERMSLPLWICSTSELCQFSLEEMPKIDQLFRSFLSNRKHDLTDVEAMLIMISKTASHLENIELDLKLRDKNAYQAISDYMKNMLEACTELYNNVEAMTV